MKKLYVVLLILALTSVTFLPVAIRHAKAETSADSWATKAPMPMARAGFGVATVNGTIYAIGGYVSFDTLTGISEMYDPATNSWTKGADMPTSRYVFGAAAYQGKIYCIGGTTGFDFYGKPFSTGINEVYDTATNTWTTKTAMPTPEAYLQANVVDGKIYCIAGNLNQVYDPATDSWTTKTPPPAFEAQNYVSAVINNTIYVIGGSAYTSNHIYDTQTDTWSVGASIPIGQPGGAAATTGVLAPPKIYVFGGTNLIANDFVQVYDPQTNMWTNGTSMPTYRGTMGIGVVNDTLYVMGGVPNYIANPLTANEQYTPIGYGTILPDIAIISPTNNQRYTSSNVNLVFAVDKPVAQMSYNLDGNVTVDLAGNTTLNALSPGSHSVTIYATDTYGNKGTSQTINFTIAEPPTPSPSVPEFPTWTATATVLMAIVLAATAVVVGRKRRLG